MTRSSNQTVLQVDLTGLTPRQADQFLEALDELAEHEDMGGAVSVVELQPEYHIAEDGSLSKAITAFGTRRVLYCDGKCSKAWGINKRPRHSFDDSNPDDYEFLADQELGEAPANPGTYEGDEAKPTHFLSKLNKWCFRECERSCNDPWEAGVEVEQEVLDFSVRRPNRSDREPTEPTPVPKGDSDVPA